MKTTRQWLATVLRNAASRLDGEPIPLPSLESHRERMLYEAEVALLEADAEAVRAAHTANMLRERINRLRQ